MLRNQIPQRVCQPHTHHLTRLLGCFTQRVPLPSAHLPSLVPTHSLVLLPEGIIAPRLRRCNSGPLHLTLFFYTSFLCYQVFQISLRQRLDLSSSTVSASIVARLPLFLLCMPFTPALPHFNDGVYELLLSTSFGRCHILHCCMSVTSVFWVTVCSVHDGCHFL